MHWRLRPAWPARRASHASRLPQRRLEFFAGFAAVHVREIFRIEFARLDFKIDEYRTGRTHYAGQRSPQFVAMTATADAGWASVVISDSRLESGRSPRFGRGRASTINKEP